MIHWIEWQFWSWKSSLATYLARQVAISSAKDIAKWLLESGNIILSNIKMDSDSFSNYFYFEDDKFLEILRTCNCLNDIERVLYWEKQKNSSLIKWKRNKFSRFYIMFDEVGALMNNKNYKEEAKQLPIYINQNRKNFQDIYIITADGEQSAKTLRRFVEYWFYVTPFMDLPVLRNIWIIRRQKKDSEGAVMMETYTWKDQNGDYVAKYKPMDYYYDWFWKPWIWKYYDDLHKNIDDPDKYKWIDSELLSKIVSYKKELIPALKDSQFHALDYTLIPEKKSE